MKSRLLLAALVLSLPVSALALDGNTMADIVKAQVIIGQVQQAMNQLKEVQAAAAAVAGATEAPPAPVSPAALTDKSGKFFLPYDNEGNLTAWAEKALGAQVGAAVGAKAGAKAGSMLAAKVPFGGLLGGKAKKKGKELGALAAVGGADFIKESSNLSFNSLEDMSLYMHLNCSENENYIKAFAAAMAIYPDLEKTYEATVKKAYGSS